MSRLAVITPSFGPDFDRCVDLHRSVLAYSPESVRHHIIVPRRDLARFHELAGPRAVIHDEAEFLPRAVRSLPGVNVSVNLRRPFPPLRGWILQQIIKLAAAARSDADVVVMVDSDIEFVRPFAAETFRRDGVVRFYRAPDEVDARLPRHVIWHQVARSLLGVAPAAPPYPDYVSSLLAWDPVLVRDLLARLEAGAARRWTDVVGSKLHFSEWTLYGVHVDEVVRGAASDAFASADPLCHAYWQETPLNDQTMADFLGRIRPSDIAVMISAKSGTPTSLRRSALAGLSSA